MVAKNYADDTLETNTKKWHDAASRINMMNGGTTPFRTVTNAKLDTKYMQLTDPLGPSDSTFGPSKEEAAAIVASQQAFEAAKIADVAARNAENIASTDSLLGHVRDARNKQVVSDIPYNPYPTRTEWTGNNNSRITLSQYIDGSHPVDLYEANGADSNRDHKSPQIPAAMRGKEQQGWESPGNSHYWAVDAQARQQGWSNEINPWTQKLDYRTGDDMQKSKSTYTSLLQLEDNEADKSFVPALAESRAVTAEQAAFEK